MGTDGRRVASPKAWRDNRLRVRLAGLLLTLMPVAGLLMLLRTYYFDVPFLDEWELMLVLPKSYEGTLTLGDLFALHNEHRVLFPKLIILVLGRLTRWNLAYETGAAVAFAAGSFGLLAVQLRATERQTGRNLIMLVPVLSLVHFSMSQWQNWFIPCQFLIFFNVLALIGAVMALSRPVLGWRHLAVGVGMGVMASYSFASGLAVWPIGVVLILLVSRGLTRTWMLGGWCIAGAVVVGLYFWGYAPPSYHPSPWLAARRPVEFGLYVLAYLGAPVVGWSGMGAALAGAVGVVALTACSWRLLRENGREWLRVLAPYWGLALCAIWGALTTGVGRVGFGVDQAISSRYITLGNLLWMSDAVLLLLVLRGQWGRRVGVTAVAALVVLVGASSVYGMLKWTERYAFRLPARAELISGGTNEDLLQRLHPEPKIVIERREILKKYGLGVFKGSVLH